MTATEPRTALQEIDETRARCTAELAVLNGTIPGLQREMAVAYSRNGRYPRDTIVRTRAHIALLQDVLAGLAQHRLHVERGELELLLEREERVLAPLRDDPARAKDGVLHAKAVHDAQGRSTDYRDLRAIYDEADSREVTAQNALNAARAPFEGARRRLAELVDRDL